MMHVNWIESFLFELAMWSDCSQLKNQENYKKLFNEIFK